MLFSDCFNYLEEERNSVTLLAELRLSCQNLLIIILSLIEKAWSFLHLIPEFVTSGIPC